MVQIDVFVTSIHSSAALRQRHERVNRALLSLSLPFTHHDVASDEEAKKYWLRKRGTSTELPCVIVDGERVGTVAELDEAVEFGELRQFLRLDKAEAAPKPPTNASTPHASTSKDVLDTLADLEGLSADDLDSFLASDEFATSAPMKGYKPDPSSVHSQIFTPQPIKPLSLGPSRGTIGSGKDRIETVRALPDRPLGKDAPRELLDLDGLGLSDEDAKALARELGLLDDDDQPVRPASPGVIENAGGAALSAPIDEVEQLHISPQEVREIKRDVQEQGSQIEVLPSPPPKSGEPSDVPADVDQEPKASAGQKSSKEAIVASANKASSTEGVLPTANPKLDVKVASAIKEGFL